MALRILIVFLALLLLPASAARAQATSKVVSSCGSSSFTVGSPQYATMDTTGQACAGGGTTTNTNKGYASTNASSTVAAGGTYQTVFASSATRHGCTIQNPSTASEVLNVRVGGAAVFTVTAGQTFNCGFPGGVITDLVEVTAATVGHAFTATSQ